MSPRKNTNLSAPLVHHIAPSAYHQHRICIWLSRFVNSSPTYISSFFLTQVKKPFIAYTLSCCCPPTHLTSHGRLLGRPTYSEAGQQRLGQSTVTSERSHYNQRKARMCRSGLALHVGHRRRPGQAEEGARHLYWEKLLTSSPINLKVLPNGRREDVKS